MLSDQGIELEEYTSRNDKNEQDKICNLIEKNYGEDDLLKRAAQLGIFAHHGALSDGVKSSIEFALQKSLISNVICTSTLAQGVNMPIKYQNLYGDMNGIGKSQKLLVL